MKRLTRKIGYVKSENKQEDLPVEKESAKADFVLVNEDESFKAKLESINEYEKKASVKITKWIKDHPEFKWGVMCKGLGIDKGNFHRTLNSKEPNIKIEHIFAIEEILKKYGYAN